MAAHLWVLAWGRSRKRVRGGKRGHARDVALHRVEVDHQRGRVDGGDRIAGASGGRHDPEPLRVGDATDAPVPRAERSWAVSPSLDSSSDASSRW